MLGGLPNGQREKNEKNIFIIGFMFMGLISCFVKTREEKFWSWFCKKSQLIYNYEVSQEEIFDELQIQLHKINPDLTFEISSVKNGKREFIISADGILDAFPAVEKLYSLKPELSEWTFIEFRPRRKIENSIKIGDKELHPNDVRFMFINDEDKSKVGIVLFCNGYTENEYDIYSRIGFLFLDECLGEYDVEKFIGTIIIQGFDSEYFNDSIKIDFLATEFDKIKANIIK
ncbi:hypothetical protein [Treponema sp. OMZ 788]|uniref:hypothetical protein n=1 Tax=Treponema sp. OMZ 788 TaxID=2563664 RepID=UPI0020A3B41A|nr:hypothetical protein [Treponema sp. OMZ 788]